MNVAETGNGATYTYTAYSDNTCSTVLDTATFTTLNLTTSSVTQTTAVLSLANHSSGWYYKRTSPADLTCTAVAAGGTGSLSNLTASTSYTYQAYSDSSCTTDIASHSFTTLAPVDLWVENVRSSTIDLTLRNLPAGAWWSFKMSGGDRRWTCTDWKRTTGPVWGLLGNTSYTVTAHTFQLTAGAIGQSSATLTLEHHEGDWSYRAGGAAGQASGGAQANGGGGAGAQSAGANAATGQCQSVPSGTCTAQLTGLDANTSYTYTAYAGGNCAGTALGQARFTTGTAESAGPPGTPASVTVTRSDGTLHASWPAVDGATSYHVTYSGDNGTSWSLAAFSHPDTSITIFTKQVNVFMMPHRDSFKLVHSK